MFPSTYTLGKQTPQQNTTTTTIHRENTDEISKILTTLYDGESINFGNNSNSSSSIDSIQAHSFFQHQQLHQHSYAPSFFHSTPTSMSNPAPWNMFTPTPVSPASSTSSCFSSSGNDTDTESDSVYSSPAFALLPYPTNSAANTSIDAMKVELDEDSGLFPMIEDLLSNHGSAVDENAAVVGAASAGGNGDLYQYSAAGFTLLPKYLWVQEEEDKKPHQHCHRHAKDKEALHISDNADSHPYNRCNRTTGGPQRLSSLSSVISFAPYTPPTISRASLSLNQKQHNHNHNYSHQDDDDAISTYSSSSSLSSAPSSRDSSPETFTTTTNSLETSTTTTTTSNGTETKTTSSDGTTRIVNQNDGSIMCFNRATRTLTFRCDLCPTQQQSFGRIHDLKRHQATKHATAEGGATKVWLCEFCKNRFVRRDALLRHYTVKVGRDDGVHPGKEEVDALAAARARAKLI
ncbi:hypothetical protein BGX30_011397 [Mortierella sp. GBA39]|nr:hypothetical protein BGX30_011397 [Mortierella sp. GBA39]